MRLVDFVIGHLITPSRHYDKHHTQRSYPAVWLQHGDKATLGRSVKHVHTHVVLVENLVARIIISSLVSQFLQSACYCSTTQHPLSSTWTTLLIKRNKRNPANQPTDRTTNQLNQPGGKKIENIERKRKKQRVKSKGKGRECILSQRVYEYIVDQWIVYSIDRVYRATPVHTPDRRARETTNPRLDARVEDLFSPSASAV